jgi:NADH:ubiquinone oxidoreductase subunit F (NADH-binding)
MRKISGKTTDNGSPKNAMESIRNATVTILSYGVRVSVQGQRIEFNIVELNVTKGRYVCQPETSLIQTMSVIRGSENT